MLIKLTYSNHQEPQPITKGGKHVVGIGPGEVAGKMYGRKRIDTTATLEVEDGEVTPDGQQYGLLDRVVPFQ